VIELADIEAARARIAGSVIRTPLVPLQVEGAPAEIYLKLENLQPINSFKIRGATNAVMLAPPGTLARGLVTASARGAERPRRDREGGVRGVGRQHQPEHARRDPRRGGRLIAGASRPGPRAAGWPPARCCTAGLAGQGVRSPLDEGVEPADPLQGKRDARRPAGTERRMHGSRGHRRGC
jgi:Pyridoxal-phosphate dependent enzyme